MSLAKKILLTLFFVSVSSCNLYRSEDRKDFESNAASFSVQNLKASECSYSSVRAYASESKLVTILNSRNRKDSFFLWEYRINNRSVFETDNLKGIYCVYENT